MNNDTQSRNGRQSAVRLSVVVSEPGCCGCGGSEFEPLQLLPHCNSACAAASRGLGQASQEAQIKRRKLARANVQVGAVPRCVFSATPGRCVACHAPCSQWAAARVTNGVTCMCERNVQTLAAQREKIDQLIKDTECELQSL